MNSLPLRGASLDQIADAIADSFAHFGNMNRRAVTILTFEEVANQAGVESHLDHRHRELLRYGAAEGYFLPGGLERFESAGAATAITRQSLEDASLAIKLASAVIMHSAFEEFLLRLCRIGCGVNRPKVLSWISKQSVQIGDLASDSMDLIDGAIELWLKKLERETVLDKWDRFVGLFGYPSDLKSPPDWEFDRETLGDFDKARHDGVHKSGELLRKFDVRHFQNQYYRASFGLLLHATKVAGCKLNPYRMFLGPDWRKAVPVSPGHSASEPISPN